MQKRQEKSYFGIPKKADYASLGIGAMIVFIAMTLVAGIAASVLIQTSNQLETKALSTGHETLHEVSGGIGVWDIVGKKGTDLQYMGITVRARAGSPHVDLNETVILLSDGQQKLLLIYNGDDDAGHFENSVDATGIFNTDTWDDLTHEEFGIIVLEDADNSVSRFSPGLNQGDKVILTVQCGDTTGCFASEVTERTDVFGKVLPEVGSPGIISFTAPSTYSDTVFDLQ